MDAIAKTKSLQRKEIPVGLIDKDPRNPNKMGSKAFDLLVDNLQRTGLTDPILVKPHKKGRYKVVGGHHRFDGAIYLGFATVPCTIITDPEFDDEADTFQMVRMNMIRGQLDPQAFFDLYEKLSSKYSDAVLQDAFGFADEAEFRRLVEQTTSSIQDPVMKEKFKEAAKEVKTIDGLARVLNEIFTKYGDTLPHGFIVFDYSGQRSVWVEAPEKTMKAFDIVGEICRERARTMDDIVGGLLQLIAKGEAQEILEKLVAGSKAVKMPAGLQTMPTKQNLDALEQVA